MRDIIRRCIFRPYRKGMGPTFILTMWDCHHPHNGGPQWQIGYRLTMRENRRSVVLFEGEDFGCSPCHGIDSDHAVEALMGFLTLRPGDTDRDYFANYTAEQTDFCQQHAEALSAEVQARFCDENGRVLERGQR